MNLQSKNARIPIAALGVTALCSAGLGIFASPAFAAPAEIALNSGATSIAVGNFGTASAATANAAYALKIQEASVANAVLAVDSAPTNGVLAFDQAASNAVAATNGFTTVPTAAVNEIQTLTFGATPTTGSFDITIGSNTTGPPVSAPVTNTSLATALNTIVGDGDDVTVTSVGNVYSATFAGSIAGTDVPTMTFSNNTLEDAGTDPVSATAATPTPGSAATAVGTIGSLVQTDYVYVTGNVPGTYKFRIFSDANSNSVYDTADERSTALVTLNVFDTGGLGTTASDTTDDVNPVLATTSPAPVGDPITADVTYSKTLSLSDARGASVATGLGGRLNDLTFIDRTSSAAGVGTNSNLQPTYSTTTGKSTFTVGTPTGAGSITLKSDLAAVAPGTYPTDNAKTIAVASNNVATLTQGTTAVEGKVKVTGGTVAAKSGTASLEFTATAADSTPLPVAGAKVTFTVAGDATNVAKLTADGTAGTATATSKVYTATTDAKGVATLKVTSSDSSSGTYTVSATSNSHSGTTQTVTYAASAATEIATTSTAAELTPTVGATSVTLKGAIKDQFGAPFVPSQSDPQQVTVQIPDGTTAGFAPVSATGTFSYVYTVPAPAPVVGDTKTFDFEYGSVLDGASPGGTIRFASASAASKVTLTTPVTGAMSVDILGNVAPSPVQDATGTPQFGNLTGAVTGTVFDASNAALAYKAVTLTGGNGVWFSTTATPSATDKLVESLDVVTDASGAISGAYVYFSKSGEHTVTATSGTATATSTVTVDKPAAAAGWTVSVDDIAGAPGSTLIVTGKVMDIFGNAVQGAQVDLSTGTSTVGSLGDSTLTTNAAGIFSTTFLTGSNSSGDVELTAEISNNPGTLTANATLVASGFTAPAAKDTATGEIKIAVAKLTLSATARVTASATGGTAKLSGTYLPNSSVDIYSKESGERSYSLLDSVTTDAEGEWGLSTKVNKSTYFLAKSNGLSSPSDLTEVWSSVSLTAKALGKGKVRLSANGDPNSKATLTFYRSIAGADPVLKKVTSSSFGAGSVTVALPKGQRSVYVTYKAAGTGLGTSKTLKVNVK
ncbi:hypothetical protein [Kineosporia sp. NBRC 101731]|uniref:beta strand repeat-containing protein n=1 Tax=Kineosporia sp. NBRC 101731 TaxID=3032199 RepID=UPI0024A10153|nr:hypothetical protein [Kineosporia sp. NBRC 101731]GLY26976.1 hypothetical protein Kisp02_03410 [Kineosporia sp. NBRC 101731]